MNVTLKEYFGIKGFTRGDTGSFAEKCGVSISYISKLVHNRPEVKMDTPAFVKVAKVVARDGYELILNPKADYLTKAAKIENSDLREANAGLAEALRSAQDKIDKLEQRIRIMTSVFKHIKIANTMLKELEED